MPKTHVFDRRLAAKLTSLRPAERRVARYFENHPEEVLIGSAAAIAKMTETSDATVIRTAKALGYSSLDSLRQDLATKLRSDLSPAARLTRTLNEIAVGSDNALGATLDIQIAALEALRSEVSSALFASAINQIVDAKRVYAFGIGPSSAMAEYFAIQLGRFGLEASSLTATGLLLADGMLKLRQGDVLVLLAYGRVYAEIDTLLAHAKKLQLPTVLFTDTLSGELGSRVDIVLRVARGRTGMMSLHTATLGLIEALLVGIAARRPTEVLTSLKTLDDLRATLTGRRMDLRRR